MLNFWNRKIPEQKNKRYWWDYINYKNISSQTNILRLNVAIKATKEIRKLSGISDESIDRIGHTVKDIYVGIKKIETGLQTLIQSPRISQHHFRKFK